MTTVLVHIGLPKTGSTFLQNWFAAHPQIAFISGQEHGLGHTGRLADFVLQHSGERPRAYVVSDENLGVAWPMPPHLVHLRNRLEGYEDRLADAQAQVCAMLREVFPTGRVLITTRGYRSFVLSAYSEYVKAGGPLGFREGLAIFGHQGRQWLEYDRLVGLYQQTFGADNVLVLPYELLRDDAAKFLMAVEAWLGVDHVVPRLGRMNPALSAQELYWYPRLSRLVAAIGTKLRLSLGASLYGIYVLSWLRAGRLRLLVRALDFFVHRAVTVDDCPDEYLRPFVGRARLLAANPLYAPYAAEYLWS